MDLVCPSCTCVFTPAAACPHCGAVYVEDDADGGATPDVDAALNAEEDEHA